MLAGSYRLHSKLQLSINRRVHLTMICWHMRSERVTKLREQRLEQQEDLEVIDESQIYVEAVQGKRSERIYGIGSVGKLYRNNGCSTSASTSSTSTCTSGIEQQVQQLVDQRVEQVVNEKLDNRLIEVLKQMFPDQDINQLLSRAN